MYLCWIIITKIYYRFTISIIYFLFFITFILIILLTLCIKIFLHVICILISAVFIFRKEIICIEMIPTWKKLVWCCYLSHGKTLTFILRFLESKKHRWLCYTYSIYITLRTQNWFTTFIDINIVLSLFLIKLIIINFWLNINNLNIFVRLFILISNRLIAHPIIFILNFSMINRWTMYSM